MQRGDYDDFVADVHSVIHCERAFREHDRLDCEQFVDTLLWEHERLAKRALGKARDDEKVKPDEAPDGRE